MGCDGWPDSGRRRLCRNHGDLLKRAGISTLRVRTGSIAAIALAAILHATLASAQSQGFAVDRFEPAPAGDTFFAADRPWYNGPDPFVLRIAVLADYAHRPLVARLGGTSNQEIVRDMLAMHAQIGVSMFDRLNVHLSIPVSFWQTGESYQGFGPTTAVTAGDPRIGVRVRLYGQSETGAFGLHLGAEGYFNAGILGLGADANTSDHAFRARAYTAIAGRGGPFAYSFSVGVHVRPYMITSLGTIGPELFLNAAIALVGWHERFTFGVEFAGSTVLANAFQPDTMNAEALIGGHLLLLDYVLIGVGLGPGITSTIGTPDYRVLGQLAWAPLRRPPPHVSPPIDSDRDGLPDIDDDCPRTAPGERADPDRPGCPFYDRDRDGVQDAEDLCPEIPEGAHPDPLRTGCPEGDRDRDGLRDSVDACPDAPSGPHPDPSRSGCPDRDSDGDGVFDAQDECPNESQGAFPDPARAGCPVPDRDHDTVPDASDRCPDRAGGPSTNASQNGCVSLVRIEGCRIVLAQPITFQARTFAVSPRSHNVVRAIADALQVTPGILRVSIEAHANEGSSRDANALLADRRAATVAAALVRDGVGAQRLESHGFAEEPATRGGGGRVELRIIDGGAGCGRR